jgi:hypothetical protein
MSQSAQPSLNRPSQISIEQFTEATFSSVLRAIDVRNQTVEGPLKIHGPIIYGIWFNLPDLGKVRQVGPELQQGEG